MVCCPICGSAPKHGLTVNIGGRKYWRGMACGCQGLDDEVQMSLLWLRAGEQRHTEGWTGRHWPHHALLLSRCHQHRRTSRQGAPACASQDELLLWRWRLLQQDWCCEYTSGCSILSCICSRLLLQSVGRETFVVLFVPKEVEVLEIGLVLCWKKVLMWCRNGWL